MVGESVSDMLRFPCLGVEPHKNEKVVRAPYESALIRMMMLLRASMCNADDAL